MDDSPTHEMVSVKLPAEKASIEAILKAKESTVTSDGLLHIANCVEANLSDALTNPHQSDDLSQYIIDLHEIMDEVRSRYAQTREKEIALESNRLRERLSCQTLYREKCQTLYRELQQFVQIANTIPTKAGRMAALFKFIEEEN
ncbi:hypothetical protein NPIL_429891 [Nephila pilipes]|uniref:Uncharacterized protein n=1 Tax=Nephila pilipes TaxID=299642 RepID=A0A8X6PE80_NEPPI|nr:hypothetical protein NPIL_481021 [Nephila pilipes]GFT63398.1 hypothetical protein NPIL_429891 [Nephila pilipes]